MKKMPKIRNSKKRSMPIVNLDWSNIQPLENRRLYIIGDDLKALIEK